MVICTIAAANHVPRSISLSRSLGKTQPLHPVVLCLVERNRSVVQNFQNSFARVVLASELGIPNFSSFIFQYNRYEACCAMKASLLLWAMRNFPAEQDFVFLDSDVVAYSRFHELESLLRSAEIVVRPHFLEYDTSGDHPRYGVFDALIAGAFDSSFLALRRSAQVMEFLSWWSRKLEHWCCLEPWRGLYVDRKWLLLGISFFNMTVLREPGYCLASSSFSVRHVERSERAGYLVDGRPLRFFHFSGVESGADMQFYKDLRADNPIFGMREAYLRDVRSADGSGASATEWSYDCFLSGQRIPYEVRSLFRANPNLSYVFPEPFQGSSDAFFAAAARPHSRSRKTQLAAYLKSQLERCRASNVSPNSPESRLVRYVEERLARWNVAPQ